MELFKTLAETMGKDLTATLVIKQSSDGRMTVCTNFSTPTGAVSDDLSPFILKGTPDELDKGFIEAFKAPIETVNTLVSNIEAFRNSAKKAEINATKTTTAKTTATDRTKTIMEEKARKDAEAKAKKEKSEKALEIAKVNFKAGKYYTAEKFFNLASELSEDKNLKNDIAKSLKSLENMKNGFLCEDTEDEAAKTMEEFNSTSTSEQVNAPDNSSDLESEEENIDDSTEVEN